ncbi:MAG: carboxymuconolactone decarboxylase family protein [Pseudomonadota bacterium]
MSKIDDNNEDRTGYEDRYVDMFGTLPPLPGKRIAYLSKASPDLLARGEKARLNAFANNAFSEKTTQLILTALLAAQASPAVKWHIRAARRAGASEKEICDAIELAGAVASLGVLNTSYAVLHDLGDDDGKGETP